MRISMWSQWANIAIIFLLGPRRIHQRSPQRSSQWLNLKRAFRLKPCNNIRHSPLCRKRAKIFPSRQPQHFKMEFFAKWLQTSSQIFWSSKQWWFIIRSGWETSWWTKGRWSSQGRQHKIGRRAGRRLNKISKQAGNLIYHTTIISLLHRVEGKQLTGLLW